MVKGYNPRNIYKLHQSQQSPGTISFFAVYTLQSNHKSSLENNVSVQNLNEDLAFYVETFSFCK